MAGLVRSISDLSTAASQYPAAIQCIHKAMIVNTIDVLSPGLPS